MVAFELEVLAKKMDRFGWDRDRNSPTHDRLIVDWMDALQDFPLDEIRAACRAAVLAYPRDMPNEGHIVTGINDARKARVAAYIAALPTPQEPERPPISAEDIERRKAFSEQVFGRFRGGSAA